MGCPNCDIESVIKLSICPRCGTMINDSVREKLASRITFLGHPASDPKPPVIAPKPKPKGKLKVQKQADPIQLNPSPKNITTKPVKTAEIIINNTNRTLMEFQSEQTKLPEWRLQLQNAVNQRSRTRTVDSGIGAAAASSMGGASGQSAAVAIDLRSIPGTIPDEAKNPLIEGALKRIESSRRKFLMDDAEEIAGKNGTFQSPVERKEYPFTIAQKTMSEDAVPSPKPSIGLSIKPTLVPYTSVSNTGKDKYDTNELDPNFIEAKVATSFEKHPISTPLIEPKKEIISNQRTTTPVDVEAANIESEVVEVVEVFDDITPFAVRFNSGLFDVIIGSFVSLIFLSPFMLLGGSWFTIAGAFGFLATFAIVMFVYLTTTIGIFGKSFGMHLFSLEMIDIGGEEYPTFHQAAVSSSVFLLSMAFGGIGFLTAFFDEDKRAIHDLVSGTIVVKEL